MVNLYLKLISLKDFSKANNEIFNAGFENLSINNIAKRVQNIVQKKI